MTVGFVVFTFFLKKSQFAANAVDSRISRAARSEFADNDSELTVRKSGRINFSMRERIVRERALLIAKNQKGVMMMKRPLSLVIAQVLLLAATYAAVTDSSYIQRIETSRREKEAAIKSEHGLLSYVGSYRLKEGENRVGSNASNDIPLPADSAPAQIGKFALRNGHVTFTASQAVAVTLDGKTVSTVELQPNDTHAPIKLAVGRLLLIYFEKDQERTVFVSDPRSPHIASFGGLDWYPVNLEWRITGKFVPHQTASKITYENAIGGRNSADNPGYVVFTKDGREFRLEVQSKANVLSAIFADESNGKTTFGGGRTLDIERGEGDNVILDFNQAVNKPCAVNPYTACSLAPVQNRLALKITAGEKIPRIQVARVATAPRKIQ